MNLRGGLLTAVLLAALLPTEARADGDPPSDILLSQGVYFPYAPNRVSGAMQKALEDTVARAGDAGYDVKVALVAAPGDLGSVANLFNQPQPYADLLTQELTLTVTHGKALAGPRVLAVQPGGLGGNNLGDNAGTALADLVPADETSDELARTAALAVDRLARAEGKPFTMPVLPAVATGGGDDGGGGVPGFVVFGAPVLLIGLALAALSLRDRPSGAEAESDAAPEAGG